MKKTLVSALTTALVVGAASTTFAAANPFADVPADHWAYDAVSELQAKGVVNGYAVDNTFRGNQNMTRYEMAQIVAKAMAKVETGDAATKAMVDKLAAEFRDELANLGVRMDDLEARMDNVKHSGYVRYRYAKHNDQNSGEDLNWIKWQLNSAMKINENVDAFARLEWTNNMTDNTQGNITLERLWVHGKTGTTDIYFGKINPQDAVPVFHGLMLDSTVAGAQVTFHKDALSWTIDAGRSSSGNAYGANRVVASPNNTQTTIIGTHVDYAKGNFDASVGYYNFHNKNAGARLDGQSDFKNWGVWAIGLGYKFGQDFYLTGDYARASKDSINSYGNKNGKDAYNIQLNYKGAKASVPHSWGAYVGYQKISPTAAPFPTYDTAVQTTHGPLGTGYGYDANKGWKIGVDYTFMKNIVGSIQYYDGRFVNYDDNNKKVKKFFGQVTFSF